MAGVFSIDLYIDNGHGSAKSSQNITVTAIDGGTGIALQVVSTSTGTASMQPGGSGTVYFQFSIGAMPIPCTTGKFVTTELATSKFGLVMTGVTT